jgi:hypothetical protein
MPVAPPRGVSKKYLQKGPRRKIRKSADRRSTPITKALESASLWVEEVGLDDGS